MKKRQLIVCIIFLFLFGGLSGCITELPGEIIPTVGGTGTIVYNDFEGGFYGIIEDEGLKLDPINLPSEFKDDGLRVRFKAKLLPDVFSYHMWGIVAIILEIERIENQ